MVEKLFKTFAISRKWGLLHNSSLFSLEFCIVTLKFMTFHVSFLQMRVCAIETIREISKLKMNELSNRGRSKWQNGQKVCVWKRTKNRLKLIILLKTREKILKESWKICKLSFFISALFFYYSIRSFFVILTNKDIELFGENLKFSTCFSF